MPGCHHSACRLLSRSMINRSLTFLIILVSISIAAIAQDPESPPSAPPGERSRTAAIEEIKRELLRDDPVSPLTRAAESNQDLVLPTMEAAAPPKGRLLPEGSFIVNRLGRMIRADYGGNWLFAFDSDGDAQQDPPMVLLPSRRLEQMEQLAQDRGDALQLVVSGKVLVYHKRNYLLPTVVKVPYKRENLSP